jgi:nucleoside-diphosphate-sugar epimerase
LCLTVSVSCINCPEAPLASKATGITELADKIITRTKLKNVINSNSKLIIPKYGDPKWLAADNRKARKLLNWEPKVSLDDGLQKNSKIHQLAKEIVTDLTRH